MVLKRNNIVTIRDKSVKNPVAHSAILCCDQFDGNPLVLKALYLSGNKSPWPPQLRVILDMQLRLGLRISEVLRISPSDLLSLSRVRIKSSKRGKDRIVNYADSFDFLLKCRALSVKPFQDYDRFYVYRAYKQHGLMLYLSKGKKYSVTHLFRHLMAVQLNKEVDDITLISELLGHKSSKSIESYISK